MSEFKNVYDNLALEQFIFSSSHLEAPLVFIWRDEPSVVIGRHQNPWIESTLSFIKKSGLKLARRHSGGGCVYHDENNINISIIGDRKLFENRNLNLRFLANFLHSNYGIKCEPTKRHDLIHSETGFKISGSAAKLGKFNCYHHFTLLVDTDKQMMQSAIRQKQQDFIHSQSSMSIRSKVINLRELKPSLHADRVVRDLAQAYEKLYCFSGSPNLTGKEDELVKCLTKFRNELEDWSWIYGMTPKFKLEKSISLIDNGIERTIKFRVHINKGLFETIEVDGDTSIDKPSGIFNHLVGTRFNYENAMANIVKNRVQMLESQQIFINILLQLIHESNS